MLYPFVGLTENLRTGSRGASTREERRVGKNRKSSALYAVQCVATAKLMHLPIVIVLDHHTSSSVIYIGQSDCKMLSNGIGRLPIFTFSSLLALFLAVSLCLLQSPCSCASVFHEKCIPYWTR